MNNIPVLDQAWIFRDCRGNGFRGRRGLTGIIHQRFRLIRMNIHRRDPGILFQRISFIIRFLMFHKAAVGRFLFMRGSFFLLCRHFRLVF